LYVGAAKNLLGRHGEAVIWLRRSIEANRNNPMAHFNLAAALALEGPLEEARAAAAAGLALNPGFTIARHQAAQVSDNPRFLAGRKRIVEGMRRAGIPQGQPP
jgi:hypothetical protein